MSLVGEVSDAHEFFSMEENERIIGLRSVGEVSGGEKPGVGVSWRSARGHGCTFEGSMVCGVWRRFWTLLTI